MSFDTERLIKWGTLSPSLQKRFTDLEDYIKTWKSNQGNIVNNKRVTFDSYPPFNAKECGELWVDTKYRILRSYAESNWEFTRAAWYDDSNTSGIVDPSSTDSKIPAPTGGSYTPSTYNFSYMTYKSIGTNVYNSAILPSMTSGLYNYYFRGTNNIVTINIYGSVSSSSPTDPVVYLLGVFYPNGGTLSTGSIREYPITPNLINANTTYTYSIASSQNMVFDVDANAHEVNALAPTNSQAASTNYGLVYFPAPFPYGYTDADMVTYNRTQDITTVHHTRNYPSFSGSYTITINITTTY